MFAVISFLPLIILCDASPAEATFPTTDLDVDILTTLRGDSVTAAIGLLRDGTEAPAVLQDFGCHLMQHRCSNQVTKQAVHRFSVCHLPQCVKISKVETYWPANL